MALNKELSGLKRTINMQNFKSANTCAFIFDANDEYKYKEAIDFINFAKKENLQVSGIGITETNEQKSSRAYMENVLYFCLNDVNWYGRPTDNKILTFIKAKHDILIDFSMLDIFAVKYFFALSHAGFKITNQTDKKQYADFVIELNNSEKLSKYRQNIIHYLNSIVMK